MNGATATVTLPRHVCYIGESAGTRQAKRADIPAGEWMRQLQEAAHVAGVEVEPSDIDWARADYEAGLAPAMALQRAKARQGTIRP